MKNKLIDLNDHLFEQLERLNDEELKGQDLTEELGRAKGIADIAQNIISNADLMFKAKKHADEYGYKPISNDVLMLGTKE